MLERQIPRQHSHTVPAAPHAALPAGPACTRTRSRDRPASAARRIFNCDKNPGRHPHLRTSKSPRIPPGPVRGSDWLSRIPSLMWLPSARTRKCGRLSRKSTYASSTRPSDFRGEKISCRAKQGTQVPPCARNSIQFAGGDGVEDFLPIGIEAIERAHRNPRFLCYPGWW